MDLNSLIFTVITNNGYNEQFLSVPESEDGNGFVTSDVPWFWGASVIGMANSSLVIGLGVSNTGGGMLLRSWLVNEGVMVRFARCCWLLGELVIQYSLLAG